MMAKLDLKVVRLSETISPFGVGAIVDIAGNSLIAMDTSWWPAQSPELSCERLERTLSEPRDSGRAKFTVSSNRVPNRPSTALSWQLWVTG